MLTVVVVIFCLSLVITFFSMRDFDVPKEVRNRIKHKKLKGTIIFYKGKKVKHYSSSSSFSSRE